MNPELRRELLAAVEAIETDETPAAPPAAPEAAPGPDDLVELTADDLVDLDEMEGVNTPLIITLPPGYIAQPGMWFLLDQRGEAAEGCCDGKPLD